MAQPGPVRLGPLRQVAVQPGDQLTDEHRVFVIGLVPGVVIGLPGQVYPQRLHTDESHARVVGQRHHRPPPMPGRLTANHHPGEPVPDGLPTRPRQQPGQRVRLRLDRPAAQHPTVVIHQRRDLLVLTQIDRQDRQIRGDDRPQRLDPVIATTIPTGQPATLGHERPPRCVWDSSPSSPPGGRSPSQLPNPSRSFYGYQRRSPNVTAKASTRPAPANRTGTPDPAVAATAAASGGSASTSTPAAAAPTGRPADPRPAAAMPVVAMPVVVAMPAASTTSAARTPAVLAGRASPARTACAASRPATPPYTTDLRAERVIRAAAASGATTRKSTMDGAHQTSGTEPGTASAPAASPVSAQYRAAARGSSSPNARPSRAMAVSRRHSGRSAVARSVACHAGRACPTVITLITSVQTSAARPVTAAAVSAP